MQNASERRFLAFSSQNIDCFLFSLACMNDDREVALPRRLQLTPEDGNLSLARRIVVVKVQTDFTPCDNAPAAFHQRSDSLFSFVVIEASIVRMRANFRVDTIVFVAHFNFPLKNPTGPVA